MWAPWRVAAFAGGLLLLGGCTALSAPPAALSAGRIPESGIESSFASLVTRRSAAVVDIATLRIGRDASLDDAEPEFMPENDFADRLAWPLPASAQPSQLRDLASGLILSSDGYILTSAHVIRSVDDIQVRLDDGRRFRARVVGIDARSDVGVLKIAATGLPTAVMGDSSQVATGDWVAAIGAPFGFHGSFTAGVVSATGRFLNGAGEIPFIQTDVAINPGSSGGPLFNSRGEVVAINALIYSGNGGFMGISFAVPINLALKIAHELRANGTVRRVHLGAEFQEVTPALAQSFGAHGTSGALVVQVQDDGPAHAAGLVVGDIVTAIDGVPVARPIALLDAMAARPAGTRCSLTVWRRGAAVTVRATLALQPGGTPHDAPPSDLAWTDDLGLTLLELTPAQRLLFRIDNGLWVRDAGGLARGEGVRPGDVLIAVNDRRVAHVADFKRLLAALPPGGGSVALLLMRDRRMAYLAIDLPPKPPAR
ncbi:trypsin-like peptidase domain-containing protein [Variovorax sp. N23]|uniref:trypsin-like peptidase domain-containing protein n=1 Tax=Variovorax sp. N23 TaxID=2980555 RepID=UPI0021C6BAFB|nr:trypsin-like peptidase domain-containing protein [Variovorax sp. N23]MCU4118773.1 trypsin-like peptidase domain-containing protein [Variovorax sp. N23]